MISDVKYFGRFRQTSFAGTVGLLLVLGFIANTACSLRQPSFAESLAGMDAGAAVQISKAHLDSLAKHEPESVKGAVREIAEALASGGDRDAAMEIAAYPYGIVPAERPDVAGRLLVSTLLPGKKAPWIDALRFDAPGSDGRQTVLFFYESRCRTCQAMIKEMTGRYSEIEKAGIRVVTISADTDKELYLEYSGKFPWKDRLCDFRSYGGPDFINYGVASVPVTFLIDARGVVADQYASPGEILNDLLN